MALTMTDNLSISTRGRLPLKIHLIPILFELSEARIVKNLRSNARFADAGFLLPSR